MRVNSAASALVPAIAKTEMSLAMKERRRAIAAGVLFFVATAAYMAGSAMATSALAAPPGDSESKLRLGLVLEAVNAVAVIGIGVLLSSILRQFSPGLALAYAGSRVVEAVLLLTAAAGALVLANADRANALVWHDRVFHAAMIVLGVGSVALCVVLYQYGLAPRLLSLLGLCGYVALIAYGVLGMLGREPGFALFIPGAIFEIAFPLWLIVKGFALRQPALRS